MARDLLGGVREARPSELLDPVDSHRRLTTRQVMELVGVKSKNTLWKRVRDGKLPRPRYQAKRQPRWVLGEVIDALAEFETSIQPGPPTESAGARSRILNRLGLK